MQARFGGTAFRGTIHINICIYIYTHARVYIYIHTHMSAYMCVCVCMYVNICNMYVCYLLDLAYNSAIKANKQINTHTHK